MSARSRLLVGPALLLGGWARRHRVQRHVTLSLASFLWCLSASTASAQIPTEFWGDWVPAAAQCTSSIRVRFDGDRITLASGADRESFAGVEMAGPGYFEPGYKGIMAVAFAEFSGDQPVIATFNMGEKRGVLQLEYASVTPVSAPNAVLAALNARVTKLNLAKRFPLNAKPLKRCPSTRAPLPR